MKILAFVFIAFYALNFSPHNKTKITVTGNESIIYTPEDQQILNHIFEQIGTQSDLPVSKIIIKVGTFFLGSPYVDHTLEYEPEQLVVNLREFDCTTFVESCLAIAKTIKSGKLTNL